MFLFERNPRSTIKKGRKAPKTTVVCCRTSDALKAEVDALCRRNNLTTSELVLTALCLLRGGLPLSRLSQ